MDELAAAEIFLQVVRTNGFTNAGKSLGKSASTLSRAITELEAELGTQLIARTTRRLHLTEAGALYMAHAESLLAARRAAHDAVAELMGGVPRGHLRVSMPVSVGERLLGPHLPGFRRRYPELRLQVDLSDRNVRLVQGGFDLSIRVGRPADSSLRAQWLGSVPVRLVASPGYVKKHGAPNKPADIPNHPCITVGLVAGTVEWSFFRGKKRESLSVEGVVHTTSPTLAAQLCRADLGLMRTTEWVVREDMKSGDLVEVMQQWACDDPRFGGVPVYVMYAQGASANPPLKSRVFVEMVKEIVATEVLGKKRR